MRPDKSALRLDPGLEILTERLSNVDVPCVIATVIGSAGSTYSKPGARMLIESDGRITGLLSGGCLEQDLREHATAVLSEQVARVVTYDLRTDNDLIFGIGAGCAGRLDILLEPAIRDRRAGLAIKEAARLSREGQPTALVSTFEGAADQRGTHLWRSTTPEPTADALNEACARAIESSRPRECRWTEASHACAAWIQPVLPLPSILICGAGPDAVPLVTALRALHYPVSIADHRPAYALADRFPGATLSAGPAAAVASRLDLTRFFAAVVMSHHLASDADYLRALAATGMTYVGVLGPRTRRRRLLVELGAAAAAIEERLRGPIGLEIGAVTPEGIALSIAAEIHAVAAEHNVHAFKQRLTFAGEQAVTASARESL